MLDFKIEVIIFGIIVLNILIVLLLVYLIKKVSTMNIKYNKIPQT